MNGKTNCQMNGKINGTINDKRMMKNGKINV